MPETETERTVFTELLDAAIAVAAYPPAKAHPNRHACQVAWSRIDRLRAAFDAAGIEWRPS